MKEKLYYLKCSLIHPFDGFYNTRFRGKGSGVLAGIILLLYGILQCVDYQYRGFIMNYNPIFEMNSISIFISAITIILLFTVSNWSVTTLFNGKGNMQGIFVVICYSLVPYMITKSIGILVSNFIIEEETMMVSLVEGIGIVWFVFLLICGLCVIHEYSLGKNVLSIFVTFLAAMIIIFLLVLFLTLEEKMFNFLIAVGREFVRRFTN
jgi:hypothetical protein